MVAACQHHIEILLDKNPVTGAGPRMVGIGDCDIEVSKYLWQQVSRGLSELMGI